MESMYYIVKEINGDYAHLENLDDQQMIVMALALLPEGVKVGTRLKYFMFSFEIM